MNEGVYIALSGAKLQELRLETVANNLANANTNGFKADRVTSGSFRFELDRALVEAERAGGNVAEEYPYTYFNGIYSKTKEVGTDFSQGDHKFTGNPLNISLDGPGFIAVDTPDGIRYTRHGIFDLTRDGDLITTAGYKVRGSGLTGLGGGLIDFDEKGNVFLDSKQMGQIEIVEFDEPKILEKQGDNLYVPKINNVPAKKPENTIVKQGFLEMANIKVIEEMVNLIELNRLYETYQKSITSIDESTKTLIEKVGGE